MAKAYVKHDYAVTGRDYVETEGGGGSGGGVSYSTEEQDTGLTWIDGSKVYQKTFACGPAPSNKHLEVPHGIEDLALVVYMGGTSIDTVTGFNPVPLVQTANTQYQMKLAVDATNIVIDTYQVLVTITDIFVTIRYTKSE